MCRLIAWAASEPATLSKLLGETRLEALVDVARLHPDGWGMALAASPGRAGGGQVDGGSERMRIVRSTKSAEHDPLLVETARTQASRVGLLHLRRATAGYMVAEENTHPFAWDGWAFAHNGTIPEAERLDEILAPAWRDRRRGTTDSERYFLCILERVEKHGDAVEGIRAAIDDIRTTCDRGSLNAVLLGEEVLAVVHARAGVAPPIHILLSSVDGDPSRLPPEHTDLYYDLRYRRSERSLVVSSTGMPDEAWEPLAPESVLVVDRRTGTVSIWPLAGGPSETTLALAGWPGR
jgi:predicted glutamine amidotransferase